MFFATLKKMLLPRGDNMRTKRMILIIILTWLIVCQFASAQETVFTLFKKQSRLADEYYQNKNYSAALQIYSNLYKKDSTASLPIKIAQCFYFLKEYRKSIEEFKQALSYTQLNSTDQFYYAESLAAIGDYKNAIQIYRECLKKSPNLSLIAQKIWRLNNIQYLYEDSVHYVVRPVSLNTSNGELCPVPLDNGLVFISNRKEVQLVEKTDAALNKPFYKAYFSATSPDTAKRGMLHYKRPALFHKDFYSQFHAGPLAFYNHQKKMVFASVDNKAGEEGKRTLHLFFAAETNGRWKITNEFPFNSTAYSVTDPSINEDGTILYFSSDMNGGFGGKDIYRSHYENGQWSGPENLGESINTPYDEVFPYLHSNRTLYFSSNGHPGMGGLDIFKSLLRGKDFDEVQNAGYPINTHSDEFGIILDSLSSHGYFTSNRKNEGYDDDLYEVDIDLQTYPLEISGLMRYKESTWNESTDLKPFAHARFYLIDNIRDVTVQEGTSDENGNFKWIIPYFSKYRIRVVGPDNDEHVVSLEIPKQRHLHSNHEIVIVKDVFRSN
jgi:tetratricopeptide (TPR) repeat protein